MTMQIPPTLFTTLLSELLSKMWFFDNGVFLGRIDALDIRGNYVVAQRDRDKGTIFTNNDRELDEMDNVAVAFVTSSSSPSAASFSVPQNAVLTTLQGNLTWNESEGKLTFNNAGTYNVEIDISAEWDNSVILFQEFCYVAKVLHYNSLGVLQYTKYSLEYYKAIQDESTSSFSKFSNLYTVSAGEYIIVMFGSTPLGVTEYPISVKSTMTAKELVKYV